MKSQTRLAGRKMDWQATKNILEREWQEAHRPRTAEERKKSLEKMKMSEESRRLLLQAFELGPEELQKRYERTFTWAFISFVNASSDVPRGGGKAPLLAYLRSHALTAEQAAEIADLLEGKYRKRRGAPRDVELHSAAMTARYFFTRWVALNSQYGVNDRGLRQKMREEAAELACNIEPPHDIDAERVIDLMRRPNYRQN